MILSQGREVIGDGNGSAASDPPKLVVCIDCTAGQDNRKNATVLF
jgi:hypothetical protein